MKAPIDHLSPSVAASDIAVIGMVGRFPGAPDVESFWRNLRDGVDSIRFFSKDELKAAGFDSQVISIPGFVPARGVLDDVESFDASFFGYSPRDAMLIDPQQRVFLECCWEALENAGYDTETTKALVGVYAGACAASYHAYLSANREAVGDIDAWSLAFGSELVFLTTRVSYKLNLKGPSCPVHTACSTSLVAVHLACQGLLNAECDVALAGGVSIQVPRKYGYLYQEGNILSPDGHCRAFDARAAGTVFSEAVGVVVLKRLETALADGDRILAVIKGTAVNNDGSRKASFTAPGLDGQATVIADAIAIAGVDPESIGYIEAHGSGTSLGDSIEVQAMSRAFGSLASRRNECAIGSVKTNLGHPDAAAGIAGLIKAILSLQNRQIPPNVHLETPNPELGLDRTPFFVNRTLADWPQGKRIPRRAGVSSFGMGGTNAHVILEEAPQVEVSGSGREWQLLPLSGESEKVLDRTVLNLAEHLRRTSDFSLPDVAYTLAVGRKGFRARRAVVCRLKEEAIEALDGRGNDRVYSGASDRVERPVAFMFSGQGSQYVNMSLELYANEPSFHADVDACCDHLQRNHDLDLRGVLYPPDGSAEDAARRLRETDLTQVALFVVEYALARLWMEWGIQPEACIGHSIGEYVAACVCGVFRLDDALDVVVTRGRLMRRMPEGAMLGVPLPAEHVENLLEDGLWLSAINGPSFCVVSGSRDRVDAFESRLRGRGIEGSRLHTSHAFHSGLMEAAMKPFTEFMSGIRRESPRIPYVSNLTGRHIIESDLRDPAYWARHLREPVRFSDGIATILRDWDGVLLEVGPGHTLCTLARSQETKAGGIRAVSSLPAAQLPRNDLQSMVGALARLWVYGAAVDWAVYYRGQRRLRVALPTYPFDRQRFAIDVGRDSVRARKPAGRKSADRRNPLVRDWLYIPSWRRTPKPGGIVSRDNPVRGPRLIFADDGDFSRHAVSAARKFDRTCIRVVPGWEFEQRSADEFVIRPTKLSDYLKLLDAVAASNERPATVLHLWNDDFGDAGREKGEWLEARLERILRLVQSCAERPKAATDRVLLITRGAHDVTGHESLCPEETAVAGLCRVIRQEYPGLACRNVDFDKRSGGIEALLQEADSDFVDPFVAYRGNIRWVEDFQRIDVPDSGQSPTMLRERGVYLITGGLGAIGLELAGYLAEAVKARLVLVGRTPLPPEDDWPRLSAMDDATGRRVRKLLLLKSLGAEVLNCQADVADETQMREVVAAAVRRFGSIHGVVHAAGLVGGDTFRPLADLDKEVLQRQLRPKAAGAEVLDSVLRNQSLDFCVLVSSLSAVLGALHYGAYAAANSFLDGYACHRHRESKHPLIAIDFDNWVPPDAAEKAGSNGKTPTGFMMTPAEGVEALRMVLSANAGPRVVVSTGDLAHRYDQWVRMQSRTEVDEGRATTQGVSHARPNLSSAFVAPRDDVERTIAEIWQGLLGIDGIGVNDHFLELGGHSLMATRVLSRLKESFSVQMPMRELFEAPTVAELAVRVRAALDLISGAAGTIHEAEPREEFVL